MKKKLNIFFGILLATNGWSNEQTILVEGLSCSANDPDKLVELWSLDSQSKTVSIPLNEFPITKLGI